MLGTSVISVRTVYLVKARGELRQVVEQERQSRTGRNGPAIEVEVFLLVPPQKGMGGKLLSGFSATGLLKRTDFNFGSKYSSPMLGDGVKLTIDIEIGKQP